MEHRALSSVFKELAIDFMELIKTELRLAKLQTVLNSHIAGRNVGRTIAFAGLTWIGLQVLTVAAVLGIGSALNNYWLGALIVGGLLFFPGLLITILSFRKVKESTTRIFRLVPDHDKKEAL